MLGAVLRLFLIAVGSVILTFLAVLLVRWMGSGQTYQAPPHAWFAKDYWRIYSGPTETLCNTPDVQTLVPDAQWIVRVPIKWDGERWIIPCANPIPITEFIAKQKHADWMLDIHGLDTWGMDKLIEGFEPLSSGRRFGAITHSQKVAKALRKQAPQWVFEADSSSILRLKVFQRLWLETAMDFWPDFVLISGEVTNQERLDKKNVSELSRRHKRIIWDVDASRGVLPDFPIHGIMTGRPTSE